MADQAQPEGTADSEKAARAFISYASQDKAVADAVCQALELAGVPCWIAPRDVVLGGSYAGEIVHAIDATKLLILILSKNSAESKHVLREVERASSKGHSVVGFKIDMAPISADLEYFLNTSQWLDASDTGVERALPRLVDAVKRVISSPSAAGGVQGAAGSPSPQAAVSSPENRRPRFLALALGVLVALGSAYLVVDKLWLSKRGAPAAPVTPAVPGISEKSIAVLPFTDMSEKKDQEYFADGLAEELIDHLAHNVDLKVIARTSSFAFKGKNEDMRSIATKLGVANLLEGSVRKAGGELRITAQLIRASDGVHLWSEIYDRKLNDIFKLQDEISTTVAKALNVALNATPAVADQPGTPGKSGIAAYNLFLKGNYFFMRGEKGDTSKAIESYRLALNLQPQYALAWAMLARAYAWQGNSWQGDLGEMTPAEAAVKGRDAAQRALAIDPNCATAYYARGNISRVIDGDWMAALSDYKRTVELDPRGEVGRHAQENILILKGALSGQYAELIDWLRSEQKRDPLDTQAFSDLAGFELFAGSLDESAADYRQLLELDSAFATAQAQYGLTLLLMGKNAEALAATEKETDDASRLAGLACVYWAMDRRADSDAALDELKRGFADRNAYLIAAAYAYRGEADTAFSWLDHAYQHAKGALEDLRVDPMFRGLHGDPRFAALLSKVKLVE
jgi:TolB-like protein